MALEIWYRLSNQRASIWKPASFDNWFMKSFASNLDGTAINLEKYVLFIPSRDDRTVRGCLTGQNSTYPCPSLKQRIIKPNRNLILVLFCSILTLIFVQFAQGILVWAIYVWLNNQNWHIEHRIIKNCTKDTGQWTKMYA